MWMIWKPRGKGIGAAEDVRARSISLHDVRVLPKMVFGQRYLDASRTMR